jgi:hypothetical protein
MRTKLGELSMMMVATICLCTLLGCQSSPLDRSSPAFSNLPSESPKLAPDEVEPSKWSLAIQALKPMKVYREGANLVVVQGLANGVESGKYIITPVSSNRPAGRFIKFTPVVVDGFSFPTEIYDYERSQP